MNGFEDCVLCRYLSVMKPAQPGLSIEHRSDDGGHSFGCFEYSGCLPLGGLPCVPESLCPWCSWPAMSTCHDQHTPCTAGGGGGVLSVHSTWKIRRKLFCLASTNIFSGVSKYSIYIYIKDYTYIFEINLVHISSALSTFWKVAGSSYRGWESQSLRV